MTATFIIKGNRIIFNDGYIQINPLSTDDLEFRVVKINRIQYFDTLEEAIEMFK